MEKKTSTRSTNEQRDKVTSVRMSREQERKIKANAKAAKLPVSSYMVNVAANGGNKLTPATLVEFQNLINTACETIKENDPDKLEEMQRGAFNLWQKLI